MRWAITVAVVGLLVRGSAWDLVAESSGAPLSSSGLTIPYVASRNDIVRDLLWMANVTTNDVVYDLGSGDGRVVIAAVRDFGARRAVGIELDEHRHVAGARAAEEAGMADRVEFIRGDLFTNDVSEASVVVLYLGHDANIRLRPSLVRSLKPGSRVVSHQYGMGEWRPKKQLKIHTPYLGMFGTLVGPFTQTPNVPDFRVSDMATFTTLSLWVVPAPVAGVWRGSIKLRGGPAKLELELHQRLSSVGGSFRINGSTNFQGSVRADVWGDHLRFTGRPKGLPYGAFRLMMDGHINGETLRGQLAVFEGAEMHEAEWTAHRVESELEGRWEWPAVDGSGNEALQIQRQSGRLTADYVGSRQQASIIDIYDFGGGFYYTVCFGRENHEGGGHSLRMDEDSGWVLGEGVVVGDRLRGRLSLYPCVTSDLPDSPRPFGNPSSEIYSLSRLHGEHREWNAMRAEH